MNMYLITSYGILESFYTGIENKPFQGLIQGNRVVSPGFLLIVVLLIRALYKANLIPPSESMISKAIYYLAGQIFVDNSDFNIMNNGMEDKEAIVRRAQAILLK